VKPDQQILIFSYHKTGTVLFQNVMGDIAARRGMRLLPIYGRAALLPREADILLIGHSQIDALPERPFRAIRSVRDPRDIWLSGYLYHLHCAEPWCRNTDFSETPPIQFPRVPAAFHARRERWRRDYLRRLGGMSYQENLRRRDRDAGLMFELDNYTGVTLEDMRAWRFRDPRILDVKMEDLAAEFDAAMRRALLHLGFAEADMPELLRIAAAHDVGRMDEAALAANPHIHGRTLSKWRTGLTVAQLRSIEGRYGDVITGLGYGLAGQG
jgi:hypothetical protein